MNLRQSCFGLSHRSPLAPRAGCARELDGPVAKTLSSRGARGLLGVALTAVLFSGCASRSQLAKLAAEKEQLVAAIESEKKLNTDLAARLQSASDRAAQAERELAQLDGGKSTRSAASLASTPARSSSSSATSLEQWSRSYSWLKYDARRRLARVDVNLAFDEQDRLTMDARRGLHQVADLLVSASAARYSIAVSGIKEGGDDQRAARRAQAIAEWLQSRGVAADRVAVSTRDSAAVLDEDGRKLKTPPSVALEIVENSSRSDAVANDPSGGDGWKSSGRR